MESKRAILEDKVYYLTKLKTMYPVPGAPAYSIEANERKSSQWVVDVTIVGKGGVV